MTEHTPSPERAALLAEIAKHKAAVAEHERIQAAQRRLEEEFFERLQPAVREAMDRLQEAKRARPALLVAVALGETTHGPDITEAERLLADAQRKVAEGREARRLVEDAAERARVAVSIARSDLDAAVTAVVSASPELAALRDSYESALQRLAEAVGALKTAGHRPQWPPALDQKAAFEPSPEWAAALAALRESADTQLPGLPEVAANGAGVSPPGKRNGARAGILADL